ACANIKSINQIHAQIFITGINHFNLLQTKLVTMYAECGNMDFARQVFDKMREPNTNTILWNAMIREYARHGPCEEAIVVYSTMHYRGIQPDNYTFPFVLKACAGISALHEGMQIHVRIIRSGLESDVFVTSALVQMYVKSGRIKEARQVFDKMSKRDVVSWNAMVAGYVKNGFANEALSLFDQMQLRGVMPDLFTMASMLQACALLGDLEQ
ncbi:hypothetical protein KI387_032474, partial [Taxus chinensis]